MQKSADMSDILIPQKIITDAYTSFSVLGLSITLVSGGIIIILSYSIEPLAFWIAKRTNRHILSAQMEWITTETLQLQRLAHEELGSGTWSHADSAIPLTAPRETLATLDLTDPCHPRLNPPGKSKNDERYSAVENIE